MKVLLALLFLIPIIAAIAPLLNAGLETTVPDQYIVILNKNATVEIRDYHIKALESKFEGRARGEKILFAYNIGTFIGFSAIFREDVLAEILQHPNVLYVEADSFVTMFDEAPLDVPITQNNVQAWGIDRISKRNLPLTGTYTYWETAGAGIVSYIIDTGILLSHTEFQGRAVFGINTVGDGNDADCNGHGTHVAGTVGGVLYGAAKKTTLVAVKVLNCGGSGTWAGVAAGVQWAATDRTSKNVKGVANMSLGGATSAVGDDAVAAAIATGLNFAIAAGNSNANACNYSPARVPAAVTAGSTTSTDARSSFSNIGTCVDLFAPGENILSAWIGSDSATNTISGTSMASPHLAGTLAVHLGHITTTETPAQSHTWIVATATPNVVSGPGTGSPNLLDYSPYAD